MDVLSSPPVLRPSDERTSQWGLPLRLLFRFCVLYFSLFALTSSVLLWFFAAPPSVEFAFVALPPLRQAIAWTATHVFGVVRPLVIEGGSSDSVFSWVATFSALIVAVLGTAIWPVLDRRRPNYMVAHAWFRVWLRFALAASLMFYGSIKVIPVQMRFPSLMGLVAPVGHLSRQNLLWFSVGASPGYEIFAGAVEFTAGILLVVPALASLGALMAFAAMVQVFVLNVAYDIPVKQTSLHLCLMALALVAPEARRLTDVLIFNRTPRPSSPTALVSTPRRARLLLAAQLLFGAYLVVMNFHHALKGWQTFGPPAPRSALYGIWTVDQIMIDGVVRPAVATDNERWRRVIFDWPPTLLTYQRMNDTLGFEGGVEIDTSARRISRSGPGATIALSYEQPAAERLNLDGRIGERQLRLEMTRLDHRTFRLLNQKIHWVQD